MDIKQADSCTGVAAGGWKDWAKEKKKELIDRDNGVIGGEMEGKEVIDEINADGEFNSILKIKEWKIILKNNYLVLVY